MMHTQLNLKLMIIRYLCSSVLSFKIDLANQSLTSILNLKMRVPHVQYWHFIPPKYASSNSSNYNSSVCLGQNIIFRVVILKRRSKILYRIVCRDAEEEMYEYKLQHTVWNCTVIGYSRRLLDFQRTKIKKKNI